MKDFVRLNTRHDLPEPLLASATSYCAVSGERLGGAVKQKERSRANDKLCRFKGREEKE